MLKPLSEQIKTLRESREWSQLQLAKKLGVEQSTVSRWERGISEPTGLCRMSILRLLNAKRRRK